jgi:hypothetical protein
MPEFLQHFYKLWKPDRFGNVMQTTFYQQYEAAIEPIPGFGKGRSLYSDLSRAIDSCFRGCLKSRIGSNFTPIA